MAGGIVALCDDIGPQGLIRIRRIEVARLADIGQSLGERTAVKIREAPVVVGVGEFGSEPDRLAVVGDGVVVVAAGTVRVAPYDVSENAFGLEPDCLAVVSDGAV